jgi:fibronectin type 3 domain-containing protein
VHHRKNSKDRFAHRSVVWAARPVVQALEGRMLLSSSPLPFVLNFNQSAGGILDANGLGTGFTSVQANRLGNEYQPNLIHLNTASAELDLTTTGTSTSGTNYGADNTQVDALQTNFDGTTNGFSITTRLKGPLSQLATPFQQGGVYFGPDQDHYVKLVAVDISPQGQTLQFTDEQGASTHTVLTYANIGSYAAVHTLDLRLSGNANTGEINGFYSLNSGPFLAVPGTVVLSGTQKSLFFNSSAVAGIEVSAKNNNPPVTVAFTHFEIDPGSKTSVPSVLNVEPTPGSKNFPRDGFVSADLHLPNAALGASTVNNTTVTLTRNSDGTNIPATVNTSGGGDTIILQPQTLLDANTSYTFSITSGVKDRTGASFIPYAMSFTTGTAGGNPDPSISFDKVALTNTAGQVFTCLKIGPDGLLYASNQDGRIFRYPIKADGTLGTAQIITSLQTYEGGPRLTTGFAFDPASTAANPILWVSNGFYGQTNAPDWDGKITKMSGSNLATVQDMIIHLPRSILNHMTNTPSFGPDGALYIPQGSNTAFGAPDTVWGMRSEHLLNAAILRIDTSKLSTVPLDVMTPDGGGTYNPYASGAPLTLYATGVRNSFSLLWDENGNLWAPTNGSSAGGNTPAFNSADPNQINGTRIDTGVKYSGPNVAGLTSVAQTEDDWMFRIVKGGYYGHPDPARGEYVLDGGNPTSGVDPQEFTAYPKLTLPDKNYRGPAWNFGAHRSPDGIIEYQGNAFGGALNGKLLVTEYSGGDDLVVLTRGASGTITGAQHGYTGLGGFQNPLSLVEDPNSGFIYVSEYAGAKITLLKPHVVVSGTGALSTDQSLMVFSGVATGNTGAGPSAAKTVTLTNTGSGTISFAAGALSIADDSSVAGDDSGAFSIVNGASLPATLGPGQSFALQVVYTASKVGIQAATLQIASNDPAHPLLTVSLHGIGMTGLGGLNEPSLPRILRAFNIPTITGDGPNDANQNQTLYPATPDATSQEVIMPRLVKAGSGPVTITPLGSFNVITNPALRFGYYTPGSPTDRTELFTLAQADAQVVSPTALGATTFDPGSNAFALWAQFPHFVDNGQQRIAYSEDSLNAWDASVHRKFRFFPLENPNGSIVPNAYIFAAEDWNVQYDSNDIVGIIRNVKAAPNAVGAAAIGITNTDGVPFNNRLIFNRIQVNDPTNGDIVHDTTTLTVRNTGTQPLTIGSIVATDPGNWTITPSQPLTTPIAPGASITLTLKFIATTAPVHSDNQTNDTGDYEGIPLNKVSGTWNDTLTITSNDPANPNEVVQLAGYWQHASGKEEEPGLQTVVNKIAGYGTIIASTPTVKFPNTSATTPKYYGEEVNAPYWNIADSTQPITVRQIAAFHNQNVSTFVSWWPQTTGTPSRKQLFTTVADEGQSLLPHIQGTTKVAFGGFTPTGTFGWAIDGYYSLDSLNAVHGGQDHLVRFFPLRDNNGNVVANSWIMVNDYVATKFENSDFQDNVYVITNMMPSGTPSTPTDLQAVGASNGVQLQWAPSNFNAPVLYNVYRGTSAGGVYTLLTSSPISATSYIDAGVASGTKAYYRVFAVSGVSQSIAATTFVTAATTVPVTPPTTAPTLNGAPSSTAISLSWSAVSGATSYRVQRKGSDGLFHDVASGITGTGYVDSNLTPSTAYTYQMRAENSAGPGPYSTAGTFTTTATQPQTLTSVDINTPLAGSTTAVGTNGYDVTAGGTDIFGAADSFRFVYRQQTGDFDISVQVSSLSAASSIDAKAGLMARASLASNAVMAFSGVTAADGYRFTRRASSGASDTNTINRDPVSYPNVYLRLQRVGNTINAYHSNDGGASWVLTGSQIITLPATLYIGMAVSAHSSTATTTAQFRGFQG